MRVRLTLTLKLKLTLTLTLSWALKLTLVLTKTFLNAVKSELTDPRNRNKEACNLPVDELNALKEFIKLQKDRVIVIKACDKGAGIMIFNFNEYL